MSEFETNIEIKEKDFLFEAELKGLNKSVDEVNVEWRQKVFDTISDFEKTNFDFYELKEDIGSGLWSYIRDKAIEYYHDSKTVFLIYKNQPDAFLRIEGDSQDIKTERILLESEITNFKSKHEN